MATNNAINSTAIVTHPTQNQYIYNSAYQLECHGTLNLGNSFGGDLPGTLVMYSTQVNGMGVPYSLEIGILASPNNSMALYFPSVGQGTEWQFNDPGVANTIILQDHGVNQMNGSGTLLFTSGTNNESGGTVTIPQQSGIITTSLLTTAAGGSYVITVTCTSANTPSGNIATWWTGGSNTNANFTLKAVYTTTNTFTITIYNNAVVNPLNGTIEIGYLVI